jgi:hypothetical protein
MPVSFEPSVARCQLLQQAGVCPWCKECQLKLTKADTEIENKAPAEHLVRGQLRRVPCFILGYPGAALAAIERRNRGWEHIRQ